jgi:uncharacterized repeat protein (TIGR03803 family)
MRLTSLRALWIVTIAVAAAAAAPSAPAQEFTVLHEFINPADPNGGFVRDTAGTLYSTTMLGCGPAGENPNGFGSVFKADANGRVSNLHCFNGSDGSTPQGPLTIDGAGNVYGTTLFGGVSTTTWGGTVFKLDSLGKAKVLVDFGGENGNLPNPGLVLHAGKLYGTTYSGGNLQCGSVSAYGGSGCGTVFELETTGQLTELYQFQGEADGQSPNGGLVRDSGGNLYGTTSYGGAAGYGTVFKLDPTGAKTILHSFAGSDGAYPAGQLLMDSAGDLYGDAVQGGSGDVGTVFKIDSIGNFTVLYNFVGGSNGAYPGGLYGEPGGLTSDSAGNLYGTTHNGGDESCNNGYGCGTVFELDAAGNETVLHSFTGPDGLYPNGSLLLYAGSLYGTTQLGGDDKIECSENTEGCGVMYKLTP